MNAKPSLSDDEKEVEERRDQALRRALNTPPKQNKDLKKGQGKKPQRESTASSKKGS